MDTALLEALSRVIDPEIRQPITKLGMVTDARVDGATAHITLLLTIVGCPAATTIEHETREAALSVAGVTEVELTVGVMSPTQRAAFIERVRGKNGNRASQFGKDSLTRVIAVTSGKGGVGKSSITAHLAFVLAERGLKIGIIDADIFGFSIPSLIGLSREGITPSPTRIGDMIVAPEAHGVKAISIGMFLGDADGRQTAVSWRGPMLHRTLEQFLRDVWFGDLDILLLDLPPGTGDVALSVGQLLPQAEVLVVTTPQVAAADVAVRSGILALQSGQRILGVVENMAGLAQADGQVLDIFGSGGGEAVVARLNERITQAETNVAPSAPIEVLAKIPLSVAFRESGDAGLPTADTDPAMQAVKKLAQSIMSTRSPIAGMQLPLHTSDAKHTR